MVVRAEGHERGHKSSYHTVCRYVLKYFVSVKPKIKILYAKVAT